MTDPAMLTEYVGFTENEVINLCKKCDMDFDEMQYWYNGYVFDKNFRIYNPKSVIDAVTRKNFRSYWTSTSFNNYLIVSLVYFPDSISQKSSA